MDKDWQLGCEKPGRCRNCRFAHVQRPSVMHSGVGDSLIVASAAPFRSCHMSELVPFARWVERKAASVLCPGGHGPTMWLHGLSAGGCLLLGIVAGL